MIGGLIVFLGSEHINHAFSMILAAIVGCRKQLALCAYRAGSLPMGVGRLGMLRAAVTFAVSRGGDQVGESVQERGHRHPGHRIHRFVERQTGGLDCAG